MFDCSRLVGFILGKRFQFDLIYQRNDVTKGFCGIFMFGSEQMQEKECIQIKFYFGMKVTISKKHL